jgi:hypothetical protein
MTLRGRKGARPTRGHLAVTHTEQPASASARLHPLATGEIERVSGMWATPSAMIGGIAFMPRAERKPGFTSDSGRPVRAIKRMQNL